MLPENTGVCAVTILAGAALGNSLRLGAGTGVGIVTAGKVMGTVPVSGFSAGASRGGGWLALCNIAFRHIEINCTNTTMYYKQLVVLLTLSVKLY